MSPELARRLERLEELLVLGRHATRKEDWSLIAAEVQREVQELRGLLSEGGQSNFTECDNLVPLPTQRRRQP